MPVDVRKIDNKFKTKKQKDMKRQMEFAYMERNTSKSAMERFKTEPFHLRYQRMMREQHE